MAGFMLYTIKLSFTSCTALHFFPRLGTAMHRSKRRCNRLAALTLAIETLDSFLGERSIAALHLGGEGGGLVLPARDGLRRHAERAGDVNAGASIEQELDGVELARGERWVRFGDFMCWTEDF